MAKFTVKAGTLEGKLFTRQMEASSADEVRRQLEEEGLVPIEVKKRSLSLMSRQRVKVNELLAFNQGLVTLLRAGIPLVEAIETLKGSAGNKVLSATLASVLKEIRAGKTFSESLRAHSTIFPPLLTASIAAGERTGDLIPSIKGYIELQKRIEAIRKKVVSAATYPLILAVASLVVVGFLITYVVPSFAGVYLSSSAELPFATKMLLEMSAFFRERFLVIITGSSLAVFLFLNFTRTQQGRGIIDRLKLSMIGLREIFQGYGVAKFSRTLGMLLTSGIPLPEALAMAKGVLGNSILEERLSKVVTKVIEGGSATEAMTEAKLMPEITLRIFSAGEKSASLPEMLTEIADYHDQDVEHRVEVLTSLIEPALMIIMGLVIGGIVLFMYLPIFQIGAHLG